MRFKLLIMCVITLLFFSNSVSSKELFNGWKNSGDNFTLDSYGFKLNYYKENEKLIADFNGDSIISPLSDCGEKDDIKICLDAVDYSNKVKYRLGGIILPGLNIRIYKLGAELTIERTISNSNPNLNEYATFEVTIKNTGDKDAENIIYEDIFPEGLAVTSSSLEGFTSSKVRWTGSLMPDKEKKFSYTIQAAKFVSYDSIAEINYNTNKKLKSGKISINVNKPYQISSKLTQYSGDLNEDVTYSITIANTGSDSLTLNKLEVVIPAYADFYQYSQGFEKKDHSILLSKEISAGEKEEIEVKIIPNAKGKYNLSTNIEMTLGTNKFNERLYEAFGVGVSNLIPTIVIKPFVARSFDFVNISAEVKNQEGYEVNITATIDSLLFKKREINNLSVSAGSVADLFDVLITAPEVGNTTYFKAKISGSYPSSIGKLLRFDEEQQLKVEPREKIVEIIQKFNESIEKEGNLTVDVYVKNLKAEEFNINIVDAIPQGFEYSGERTNEFSLKGSEEKKAYSYTLKLPKDFKESRFRFTTKLSIKTGDGIYSVIKEGEVKVGKEEVKEEDAKEKEGNETVINTSSGSEIKKEDEKIKPQKTGFFRKIINFFKNLF